MKELRQGGKQQSNTNKGNVSDLEELCEILEEIRNQVRILVVFHVCGILFESYARCSTVLDHVLLGSWARLGREIKRRIYRCLLYTTYPILMFSNLIYKCFFSLCHLIMRRL